jgi:hypothetical protein
MISCSCNINLNNSLKQVCLFSVTSPLLIMFYTSVTKNGIGSGSQTCTSLPFLCHANISNSSCLTSEDTLVSSFRLNSRGGHNSDTPFRDKNLWSIKFSVLGCGMSSWMARKKWQLYIRETWKKLYGIIFKFKFPEPIRITVVSGSIYTFIKTPILMFIAQNFQVRSGTY